MAREIRFNAFDMNCVAHQSPGLWRASATTAPGIQGSRLLDRARRSCWSGASSTASSSPTCSASTTSTAATSTPHVRHATQIPVNDPAKLVLGDGAVTENLGFGLTASISFEHPYHVRPPDLDARPPHQGPRRLEHRHLLSRQRRQEHRPGRRSCAHDDRYDVADEYLEVCYKLWEGSWEDDAVLRDRARRHLHRPGARSTGSRHDGRFFKVPGIHLSEPSPQRTPVIYLFSPGICWSGLSLNRCGCEVQALQMNSYGVRPLRVLSLLAKL